MTSATYVKGGLRPKNLRHVKNPKVVDSSKPSQESSSAAEDTLTLGRDPVPTITPKTLAPLKKDDMRKAMSAWPTGVAVVTVATDGEEGPKLHGMTVSSLSSVSLDPPLVSFSTTAKSKTLEMAQDSGSFGVNILAEEQQAECWNFCGNEGDRFESVSHHQGSVLPVPLLDGAASYMECEVHKVIPVTEDRVLVLGKVVAADNPEKNAPMVNYNNKMGSFSAS